MFYHKSILLLFLNLERDSKQYMETAENSESIDKESQVGRDHNAAIKGCWVPGTAGGVNVFVE